MGPLDGVNVLDLGGVLSVPYAATMLAELGADVIKVESRDGDQLRGNAPMHRGMSAMYYNANRGKRGIVLDLKSDEGSRAVHALIAKADVVMENWRPGVAERLGLGLGDLRARHPALITASVRGFGATGPYAGQRVYDPIIQGVSSMAATQDEDTPQLVTNVLPDKLTSMSLTQGILAALVQRGRTGRGDHVEVTMLDTAISFLWPDMMQADTFVDAPPTGKVDRNTRVAQILRAGDGKWLICTATTNAQWRQLCRTIERPEWIEEFPELADRRAARNSINDQLTAMFQGATRDQVLTLFSGADIPCGPLNTVEEMLTDPQVRANEVIREVERPGLGIVREPAPHVRVGTEPWQPTRLGAPRLGEHTEEVLTELGLNPS
ncbi:CaiB/BaiF CoA transferase family protein [Rhodococcus opacus]|uniref:CaiB/BaiF family protein n=1 Tax=Rhodococcus opacus (strain B4) TaxID=632772 RepID=C1B409_RHOOB|nr:CoA transferase [Rhodococcus opacus]BAH50857.1 CaiB/BaiF family protein [Rhodococcus opacus B4]